MWLVPNYPRSRRKKQKKAKGEQFKQILITMTTITDKGEGRVLMKTIKEGSYLIEFAYVYDKGYDNISSERWSLKKAVVLNFYINIK